MTYHNILTGLNRPCSLEKIFFSCLRKFSPLEMRVCALPCGELTQEGEELAEFFADVHDLRHAARDLHVRADAMNSACRRTWSGCVTDEPIDPPSGDFFNLPISCDRERYGNLKILVCVYYKDAPAFTSYTGSCPSPRWWHWKS